MIPDTYKYNSVDVACAIIAYANEHKVYINMTKTQKLLYIAYGAYLAIRGERLTNEHPQAWPYGPVFPTTRNKLLYLDDFSEFDKSNYPNQEIFKDNDLNALIAMVFYTFGKYNAASLSEWSHKSNSPWDRTVKTSGFNWGDRIPDEYIKEYFDTLLVRRQTNGN